MSRARILADYVSSGDELADKAPLASPAFTGSPSITLGSDATGDVYYRAAGGALTRLATGADGTVLTSTGAAAVPAFEAVPASGDNTPSFMATLSQTQSITTSTYVLMSASVETWDTDSAYDNTDTNYKFTVPSGEGGKYLFMIGMGMADPGNAKLVQITPYVDGSPVTNRTGQERHLAAPVSIGSDHYITTTTLLSLSAGQYVQAYVYNSSTSQNKNMYQDGSFFGGFKLAGV